MEQIKQARALARSFGAPYIDWHFVVPAVGLCLLIFALYSKVFQPLYLNFVAPLRNDLLCLILNESEGRKQVDQMIARATQDLNTNYYSRAPINWSKMGRHKTIEHQMAILGAEGRLEPENRKPERILLLSKFCLILCAAGWLSLLCYAVSLMFVVPKLLSGVNRMHFEPMDLLVLGEALLLISMVGNCLGLYYTIMAFSSADQILTVSALLKDFRRCIGSNEFNPQDERLGRMEEQEDEADRSLLDLIVKFRMFRLQTKASLQFNGQHLFTQAKLGAYSIIIVYATAIHFNIHFLMLALVFLVIILTILTTFWIPTCFMHSRCEDLYRALYSLNAHIICLGRENRLPYQPQIVDILNRELKHPEELLDDFACQFLSIRFTYRDLLKYQFFYGLGMILIYFQYRNKERPTSLLALL